MFFSHDVVRFTGVALLLGAALAAAGSQQIPGDESSQAYILRTTSRLVLLDVSVKDSKGGFVSGLTEDQFKVYEDGKPQVITQFANSDVPVTVGIIVDDSQSMQRKRPEVITAALEFIHDSNPQDEMFVVNFNERARRGLPDLVPFSGDINQLRAALWQGTPEGRTALYDAIELGLRQLQLGRRSKQALVVISDGGDNISKHNLTEVMNDLLNSMATVYTVGIFDQDDPERNPGVLEKLAHVSGGTVFFPKQLDQVIPICKQIAKDIRTRYTIGYIPSSEGKTVRHIKVTASAPGHENLIVRTRTSYAFSPESEAAATK
jgi:Ca-activated chloride channel family protein